MPADQWSDAEKQVFEKLKAGAEFDARSAAERQLGRGQANIESDRPVTIGGAFLSEIIRLHTDEFPRGVQIQGVKVEGEVQVENARSEKILSLEHCYFTGPIIARGTRFLWVSFTGSVLEDYLDLRSSVISGALFLRWGFRSLTCTLARDVAVNGPIDCDDATFKYDSKGRLAHNEFAGDADGECFSLARSTASALYWRKMRARPDGIVNLRNCQIKSFRDSITSAADVARDWPSQGNLRMTGLKYDERTSTDPKALLAWIELEDRTEERFGIYQTVTKVLTESGHELSANEIILAKQRYTAGREHSLLTKSLRYIYIWLSKAGLGTDRIALITIVAFAACLAGIYCAERTGQFEPKNGDILKDPCYQISKPCPSTDWKPYHDHRLPPYYPNFNFVGYTIDLFVPGVSYGVSNDWRPRSDWMIAVTVVIRVMGSLLVGLLIVCVSGIARFSR